jgi:hypothetical protein
MRIITICVRNSDKIGSKTIRFATGEEFSHIGVQLGDDKIYHSDIHGCRVCPITEFVEGNNVRSFYFRVEDQQFADMKTRAAAKLGTKYDVLGLIGFGVLLLLKRIGIRVKVPMMNPKWMFCSEYAEYILTGRHSTMTPVEVLEEYRENKV